MSIGNYTFIKSIGRGSFGEVLLARKNGTNQLFAAKKMDKNECLAPDSRKFFNREIEILKFMNHPNIIKLVDIQQDALFFYIFQEFCNGGSLSECLKKYKSMRGMPFPQEIVQHLMRQICNAIQYLHNNGILHRDLKLENILVNFDNEMDKNNLNMMAAKVKIIDFGFARTLHNGETAKTILGSPVNMAPQLVEKIKQIDRGTTYGYDQLCDIWSLGTLCFEMLIGVPPFDCTNVDQLLYKIQKGIYKIPPQINISQEAASFLNGMLRYNPNERLNINQLCTHVFLTKDVRTFVPLKIRGDIVMSIGNFKNRKPNNQSIWDLFQEDGKPLINDIDCHQFNGAPFAAPNQFGGFRGQNRDYLGGLNGNNNNVYPGYLPQNNQNNYNNFNTFGNPGFPNGGPNNFPMNPGNQFGQNRGYGPNNGNPYQGYPPQQNNYGMFHGPNGGNGPNGGRGPYGGNGPYGGYNGNGGNRCCGHY